MADAEPHLLAFNRGEVSKIALARIDLAKMQLAADCQVNWMPHALGPMMLRPGLAYVGGIYNDSACGLLDFIYGKSDTALIELTDSLMRVWINDVLVSRPSVATVVADPNMNGGGLWSTTGTTAGCSVGIGGGVATLTASARGGLARMWQTLSVAVGDRNKEHALRVVVSNGPITLRAGTGGGLQDYIAQTVLDTGTHSLAFTPNGAAVVVEIESTDARDKTLTQVTIEAAGTMTLPTPWTTATLPSLRWTQSKDVLYVGQYGGQQYKIERRGTRPGARGWSVVKYRSNNGPFLSGPSVDATLTPAVLEGIGSLTCSLPYFTANHIGALFRLFSPGQTNATILGSANAYTEAVRVTGISSARAVAISVSGVWAGTIAVQRSLEGPDAGFVDVSGGWLGGGAPVFTGNFTGIYIDDLETAAGNAYDNVVAWYRVGFKAGNYTSGSANATFSYNGGGRHGLCRVTAYSSPFAVSMEVLEPFSSTTPTKDWQESAWSPARGWPNSPALHEGRLWWFGGGDFPVAGSQADSFTGFAVADRYGDSLGDAGAILEDFGEGPSDRVNWGLPLSRLLAGREGSIASIRSSSFDTPLTPTDISIKDCSQQGASALGALKVGKRGVFVQSAGNRVYELFFDVQQGDYHDRDLTRFNTDIGVPGFVDAARAVQPDTTIYLPRNDGIAAALLYDPNDEVEAWWRVMTLGVIENVRVLPRASGGDDLVYFCVKRIINGVTRRFLERFTLRSSNAGGLLHLGLDSHVTYSGAATNTITAAHLPNTTVTVWADGAPIGTGTTDGSGVLTPLPDGLTHGNIVAGLAGATATYSGAAAVTMSGLSAYNGIPGEFFAQQEPSNRMVHVGTLTPSGGAVSLPNGMRATSIVGFFGFMAPFMSAKLAYGALNASPLSRRKRIDHLGLVMFDAHPSAIQYGQRFDKLDAMPAIEGGDAVTVNTIWSHYNEPLIEVPGEWTTDARLCLLGQAPYPCKLGGVALKIEAS